MGDGRSARLEPAAFEFECVLESERLRDEGCGCYAIVRRAYDGMTAAGYDRPTALDAARRVLTHHHPEKSLREAQLIVEHWFGPELRH